MEKHITVVPEDRLIIVDGDGLFFDFQLAPGHEHMHALQYDAVSGHGEVEFEDDWNQEIDASLYDEEVAPYVAAWEQERARVDALQAAAEAEYNRLENVQARKKDELSRALTEILRHGHTASSLGFEINADEKAEQNVRGLISIGEEPIQFMSYDNTQHEVSLADLRVMELEISRFIKDAYAKKWALRDRINACTTKEAVDAITWDENLNDTTPEE